MIEKYSFGSMVIKGKRYTSDLKIINGKVVPNWWRKSGHIVVVDDILDILAAKPDILVLGKGKPGLMKSTRQLKEVLQENSIELIEETSESAMLTFNKLFERGEAVCAGFHLTC